MRAVQFTQRPSSNMKANQHESLNISERRSFMKSSRNAIERNGKRLGSLDPSKHGPHAFSIIVQYSDKFRGMKEVILDSAHCEATSAVNFQAGLSDGSIYISPYFIDSVEHFSGPIMNANDGADTNSNAYVSHGRKSMRFVKRLKSNKEYHAHVRV